MALVLLPIIVNVWLDAMDFYVNWHHVMVYLELSATFVQVIVNVFLAIIAHVQVDILDLNVRILRLLEIITMDPASLTLESNHQIFKFVMGMELVFLRIIAHAMVDGREVNVSNSHVLDCCQHTVQFAISREVSVFGKTLANAILCGQDHNVKPQWWLQQFLLPFHIGFVC